MAHCERTKPGLSIVRDAFHYSLLNLLMLLIGVLPYPRRIAVMGRLAAYCISPIAGWRKRIRSNLAMVMPDLPKQEVDRLLHAVPDNFGRSFAELHYGQEFFERAANAVVEGPGIQHLKEARRLGRPVVFVSGHIGNPYATPIFLMKRGFEVGSIYRRLNNRFMNEKYVKSLQNMGIPTFEKGKRGMVAALRHLKQGGILGMLIDVHIADAPLMDFLGKPAATSTASAELALKYDAALIPIYAIRLPNGLDFRIVMQAEIPHSDAISMTRKIVDGFEDLVRSNMDQWFWIHRRWKGATVST